MAFDLHGEARRRTPEYQAWKHMRARCYNRKGADYKDYGGRGITVCDRWNVGEDGKHPFVCFLEDMGRRPSPKHSVDRKNTNGHYGPDNCRWATWKQQSNNRRAQYNQTGESGVHPCGKGYMAQLYVEGRNVHLGVYSTTLEAAIARELAKLVMKEPAP